MPREIQINFRVNEEEQQMLTDLAVETVRSTSDMIRFLIKQEWNRRQVETLSPTPQFNGQGTA